MKRVKHNSHHIFEVELPIPSLTMTDLRIFLGLPSGLENV